MNLRSIHDTVPNLSDEQIRAVASAIAAEPDRVMLASALGLTGDKITAFGKGTGIPRPAEKERRHRATQK